MKLRKTIRPALSCAFALCLFTQPALAQDDDSAVEATQEELDAVGGLRGKEKAPTLESVDTAPTSTSPATTLDQEDETSSDSSTTDNDGLTVNFRFGLGFSAMQTPGFNTDFSVRDDSPSRSIYSFSADVPATESQTHISGGVNILWDVLDPVRVGLNLDIGYAPLTWDGAGIFAFSIGPSAEIEVADSVFVGAALGLGLLSYQIGFDVEAADAGDAYMTFQDTDIYFDDNDEAQMTVRKSGFLLAPELNVAYQPDNGIFGVVFRVQYLSHSIDTEAPWELSFSENSDSSSSEESSSTESVEISYEGDYVVGGSELPKVFDFSGLAYHIQMQFRF